MICAHPNQAAHFEIHRVHETQSPLCPEHMSLEYNTIACRQRAHKCCDSCLFCVIIDIWILLKMYCHFVRSRGRGKATGWTTGVRFSAGAVMGCFLFATASRPALEPTQPPIQWVPASLTLGIKWPGREADCSPPSSYEAKNVWGYTSTPAIRLHVILLS
jgi:hypothetical protein